MGNSSSRDFSLVSKRLGSGVYHLDAHRMPLVSRFARDSDYRGQSTLSVADVMHVAPGVAEVRVFA